MEKPIYQPKVQIPKISRIHDKIVPIPDYAIPHTRSRDESEDVNREMPIYPDPTYRPPDKPVKLPTLEVPKSLSDFDPENDTDVQENSSYKKGVISEMYQRPDKSYFHKPQELHSLINTDRLVQKFLPKQADIDKI